ncbi:MAG: hypothetical protein AAFP98_08360 [Pseudomonadota bacterium]
MKLTVILALTAFVAGCEQAYAQSYLTASNGMTLYTFDRDGSGVSNCYDSCATSWPPFLAPAGAQSPGGGLTAIQRNDGSLQWAKNGAPLYFWQGDRAPGDTTGDGVGGVWHVAR